MGAAELLIPLDGERVLDPAEVGGKAARLARLAGAGHAVPRGYCLSAEAYGAFLDEHRLEPILRAELGRRPLAEMRWEEMWDAALRVRTLFLRMSLPAAVAEALDEALSALGRDATLVVRSSAPREDAAGASFAGLHESVDRVRGADQLADAVRVVWASLWSDAALLYLAELGLDPARSRMAVVLQERIEAAPSGVAFGVDPRDPDAGRQVVEAVPGACADLVDGAVDPDRWVLSRANGEVLSTRLGEREAGAKGPLLGAPDLERLHGVLGQVESLCGWPPDVEWTGKGRELHLLQARPVTAPAAKDDERRWYLGLRPGLRRLRALRQRVAEQRIPELEREGEHLAREDLEDLDDAGLARALDERAEAVNRWRAVYRDEFIPLAHGLRALGTFYDDLVRPSDPFEFVDLVRGEDLLALRRNLGLAELAGHLRASAGLAESVERALEEPARLDDLRAAPGGAELLDRIDALGREVLDHELGGERLGGRRDVLLRHLLELGRLPDARERAPASSASSASQKFRRSPARPSRDELEARLFAAAGPERAEEVREHLALGRLSWRLRDDDNLLLGKVESQLLRAVEDARRRLVATGRLATGESPRATAAPVLAAALRDPQGGAVRLPEPRRGDRATRPARARGSTRPRQLAGQAGAPGIATGPARHVRSADDVGRFRQGDVLLCDAVQPNMTLLVPLAAAIVERRGGMLIHGAIIARELGIPCVNGVSRALVRVPDGEIVTVDGDLGLVTVGEPELRLEGVDPT